MGTPLRLVKDMKPVGSPAVQGTRVRRVFANEWQTTRIELFRVACRFSAAAKSYRTALGVTQAELGKYMGVTNGCIAGRESGKYFGWDDAELKSYCRAVNAVAAARAS